MTRHVRSWAIAALAVFALAGAVTPSSAEIVYGITNYADGQDHWALAGTITASGPGTFSNANAITAWDFTASKSGSPSHRYSNDTSGSSVVVDGTLDATSTTLSLAAGSKFIIYGDSTRNSSVVWANVFDAGFFTFSDYSAEWNREWLWKSNLIGGSPYFSPIVGGAWTLGTASAVPEIDPATGGSALSLVAGVLAMIEQRRRRAALVA